MNKHPQETKPAYRRGWGWILFWLSLSYWGGAALMAYLVNDLSIPDAVSYLKNAQHILDGHFMDSVSGYWSPLISWSTLPLLAVGLDGPDALRWACYTWGWVLLIACCVMLKYTLRVRGIWLGFTLLLITTAFIVNITHYNTPDVVMSAGLVLFCILVASPRFLTHRSISFWAGLCGGVSFLGKSYALPFVLAYTPLAAWGAAWAWKKMGPPSSPLRPGRAVLLTYLGFLIFAGSWIGILSAKYGKFTITTSGPINHALIGPPDQVRFHPLDKVYELPEGVNHIWETPDRMTYAYWSPFDSAAHFVHQIKFSLSAVYNIFTYFKQVDLISMAPLMLAFVMLLAWRWEKPERLIPMLQIFLAIAVYCGGFILIFCTKRYLMFFVWPLVLCLSFGAGASIVSQAFKRLELPSFAAPFLFLGFGLSVLAVNTKAFFHALQSGELGHPIRQLVSEVDRDAIREPVMFSPDLVIESIQTSYQLNKPFVGAVVGENVEDVEQHLQQSGAKSLMTSSQWPLFENFKEHSSWKLLQSVSVDEGVNRLEVRHGHYVVANKKIEKLIQIFAAGKGVRNVMESRGRTWHIFIAPDQSEE